MLAQARLGVEKTDRNRCTSLYSPYSLYHADVEPWFTSSRSCEGAESIVPILATISKRLSLEAGGVAPL